MNDRRIRIRTASAEDAEALRDLYAPYVAHTAITFEYEIPTVEEFRQRIRRTLLHYPYLVAESGDEILGYAYTGPLGSRAAFAWSAECSIYLRQDRQKMGVGRMLYQALEEISRAQNLQNLYACIANPWDPQDPYVTRNSLEFHEHLGYEKRGEFFRCGYKFGRWYNLDWMEKYLGSHEAEPKAVIAFPDLDPEILKKIERQET